MKNFKKICFSLLIIFSLTFAVPNILPLDNGIINVKAATKPKLNKKNTTLIKGQTLVLKVSGTKSKIKWSSSNKTVATVNSTGKVTAKKKGTATITAKIRKKTLSCKITVETPSINKKTLSLQKGETYSLKINGTKQKVKWSSSDKNIATVNKNGKVTAKKAGSAKIFATVSNKKYICKLTVKANSNEKAVYKIGETWTVAGQWKITINSVEETSYRNPFAETNPETVYMVTYTYENLGYTDTDGIMNGLFVDLELGTIVDAQKCTGYSYPGEITYYAQEIPIGSKCKAQACIGVDHSGDFKIYYDAYDGNFIERKAVFKINVK